MKKAIIYYSTYGTTKQYAIWLNEQLNYDILDFTTISKEKLLDYEEIIVLSNIMHNKIGCLSLLKKFASSLQNKLQVIIACGVCHTHAFEKDIHALFTSNIMISYVPGCIQSDVKVKDYLSTYLNYLYYHHNPQLRKMLHEGTNDIDKTQITHILETYKKTFPI